VMRRQTTQFIDDLEFTAPGVHLQSTQVDRGAWSSHVMWTSLWF
jgi:hypothetical protein